MGGRGGPYLMLAERNVTLHQNRPTHAFTTESPEVDIYPVSALITNRSIFRVYNQKCFQEPESDMKVNFAMRMNKIIKKCSLLSIKLT